MYPKRLLKLLALVVFCLLSSKLMAQQPLAKTLLWKISGNGLSTSSYLYGSMHMICSQDYFLSDQAKQAFQSCDRLVFETNIYDTPRTSVVTVSDTLLSQKLPAPLFNELDSILSEHTGVSLWSVNRYQLSIVMQVMNAALYDCSNGKSYEAEFYKMAVDQGKLRGELENASESSVYMTEVLNDNYYINMVRSFNVLKAQKKESLRNYQQANLEALYGLGQAKNDQDKQTILRLVDERNKHWMKRIPGMMKEKSNFFTIGAGHLAGPNGLITQLKNSGYRLEPVLK